MKRVYTIRLVRPLFETAVIEVEAFSENVAVETALEHAETLRSEAWRTQEFDDAAYGPHVESVVENQEIYETSLNPHRELREFRTNSAGKPTRKYLLLSVDADSGMGELHPEPWFAGLDGREQADLCADWLEPLALVVESDGLTEHVEEAPDEVIDDENVVAFPRK
ncbi:MAG: hypothetical protein ACR2PO_15600 [Methyloligellaceae bacterium]